MISNLIAKRIDDKLSIFCEKRKLNYSRYADDITISGGRNLPKFKEMIFYKIEKQGFSINYDKVRLHDRGSSQRVTGLVVNDKISIGRKRKKWLRAIVYNVLKNGPVVENRNNNPFFKEWLFGHLGHAKMVEPDFADPLIESLKQVDWNTYYESLVGLRENEINRRSLKRQKNFIEIPFNDLGCFKNIDEIPQKWPDELRVQLDNLLEKCPKHSTDECKDCLNKQDEIYEICMKYILGHCVGNTGGHHHGHEVYDIACSTDLYNDTVFVAFLAKSGKMTGVSNNSIFRQTHACTKEEEIDVISIVTTNNLDHKLLLDLKDIIRKSGKEHKYCLIMRNEMARIVQTFNSGNI